jgi:hypothetical protein
MPVVYLSGLVNFHEQQVQISNIALMPQAFKVQKYDIFITRSKKYEKAEYVKNITLI